MTSSSPRALGNLQRRTFFASPLPLRSLPAIIEPVQTLRKTSSKLLSPILGLIAVSRRLTHETNPLVLVPLHSLEHPNERPITLHVTQPPP